MSDEVTLIGAMVALLALFTTIILYAVSRMTSSASLAAQIAADTAKTANDNLMKLMTTDHVHVDRFERAERRINGLAMNQSAVIASLRAKGIEVPLSTSEFEGIAE